MKNKAAALVVTLLLVACTSVELAPVAQDMEAKRFAPVADKAIVYVIQTGAYGSSRVFIQVTLDGQHAATLSGDTYSRLVVAPGTHRLALATPENQEAVTFQAGPGEALFFSANSKIGWTQMRVTSIQRLPTQDGQQAVLTRKLAAPLIP